MDIVIGEKFIDIEFKLRIIVPIYWFCFIIFNCVTIVLYLKNNSRTLEGENRYCIEFISVQYYGAAYSSSLFLVRRYSFCTVTCLLSLVLCHYGETVMK